MKNNPHLLNSLILLFVFCLLPACTAVLNTPTPTIPPLPTSTATAIPTLPPTPTIVSPQVITGTNATLIKAARDYPFNQPAKITWVKNSQSFWVVSDTSASKYNASTGEADFTFNAVNPGRILGASSDGDAVLYLDQNQNEVRVFRQSNQKTLVIKSETMFETADFSPDGMRISVPSLEQLRVSIWDSTTGLKLVTLKGFDTAAPVYDASIGADNSTLIWHSRARIQLQNISNQQMGPVFSHEDFVMGLALTNSGDVLASAAGGTIKGVYSPVVYFWDARSGNNLAQIPYPDSITALTFSPDGKLLAGASGGNLIIMDTAAYKVIHVLQSQSNPIYDLAFSPDGKSLLSSSIEDNQVKLWQVLQ